MSYQNKLTDPRWQKLRLKVMQRDEFCCAACGDDKNTLHVHHRTYHPEPWLAPFDELVTLCKTCHENLEIAIRMIRENPEAFTLPFIIQRSLQLWETNHAATITIVEFIKSKIDHADNIAANTREKRKA